MSQAVMTVPATPIHSFAARPQPTAAPETLDRLFGQSVRFGILRALLTHEALSFSELKRLMQITDGNLSMHARKLEDASVLSCTKGFRGRFPRTEYRLTDDDRRAFQAYATARETA